MSHLLVTNYEHIARVCHEANRALCQSYGDDSQVSWDEAPEWQRESCMDGVEGIFLGDTRHPADSHERWMETKRQEGWTYGPVKNERKREHPCMVPYAELPPQQQLKDHLFFGICQLVKNFMEGNGS